MEKNSWCWYWRIAYNQNSQYIKKNCRNVIGVRAYHVAVSREPAFIPSCDPYCTPHPKVRGAVGIPDKDLHQLSQVLAAICADFGTTAIAALNIGGRALVLLSCAVNLPLNFTADWVILMEERSGTLCQTLNLFPICAITARYCMM